MEEVTFENYLIIPENKIKFEAFNFAFKLKFPKLKFEKCSFNLLGENLFFIISGEGDAIEVNDLLREFFPLN